MAFLTKNIAFISSGWAGPVSRIWSYDNVDNDDFATVTAAAYFDELIDQVENGDQVIVKTDDLRGGKHIYILQYLLKAPSPFDPVQVTTFLSNKGQLLQGTFADIGTSQAIFMGVPTRMGGLLVAVSVVLSGAISGVDEQVVFFNNGAAIANATIIVPVIGSGAGVQTTKLVVPEMSAFMNTEPPGSALEMNTPGLTTGPIPAFVSMLIV